VVLDVVKEYNAFIFEGKEVSEEFKTAWMEEMYLEDVAGWWLTGKLVSQAGACGRGVDVQL
jgi:hypothetical protein